MIKNDTTQLRDYALNAVEKMNIEEIHLYSNQMIFWTRPESSKPLVPHITQGYEPIKILAAITYMIDKLDSVQRHEFLAMIDTQPPEPELAYNSTRETRVTQQESEPASISSPSERSEGDEQTDLPQSDDGIDLSFVYNYLKALPAHLRTELSPRQSIRRFTSSDGTKADVYRLYKNWEEVLTFSFDKIQYVVVKMRKNRSITVLNLNEKMLYNLIHEIMRHQNA